MNKIYKWKLRDTIIIDIFFNISFIGIIILLAFISFFYLLIFILFYIIMNLLIAIICHDCPHQGHFCPGLSQLLFGALLSKKLIKKEKISRKMMRITLIFYTLIGMGNFIFSFIVIIISLWSSLFLITLIPPFCFLIYATIAWPILCPKCSNKENCPVRNFKKYF